MAQNNFNGALQRPIGSGFDATSTSSDVIKGIDLTGKNVIVTGGNTGIGLETVKTFANAGANVIVPARNMNKAKQNLHGIVNVVIEEMDLLNPTSINNFANAFLKSGRPLHLLVNNAGIMFVPLRRDIRGMESQLATNYLAIVQLTSKLWPALKRANGARVINVSSQGHQFGSFNFDDPNFKIRDYDSLSAYGQSKSAVNLFSLELDNRAKDFGVRAYSVHPGNVWGTELLREAPIETLQQFGFYDANKEPVKEVVESLKTIPQGAATIVWAGTSSYLNDIGGVYLEDVDIAELSSSDEGLSSGVKPYSLDENDAKRLWKLTEELAGIQFTVD